MNRSLALVSLAGALVLSATACADDDKVIAAPPTTVAGIEYPQGGDDTVLQWNVGGGFVPADVAFGSVPSLTILGDGTVLAPGAMIEIYPGPMVAPMFQRTLTPEGLQRVLEAAESAGLLQTPPSYDSDASKQIADAPTTSLVLNAGGGSWSHVAYALNETALDTPARQALAGFLTSLSDLDALAGPGALSAEVPYVPTRLLVRATPNPAEPSDITPTVAPWPDPAFDLSAATQCAVLEGPAVATLLAANQLSWFTQNGTTYSLAARPALPGDTSC